MHAIRGSNLGYFQFPSHTQLLLVEIPHNVAERGFSCFPICFQLTISASNLTDDRSIYLTHACTHAFLRTSSISNFPHNVLYILIISLHTTILIRRNHAVSIITVMYIGYKRREFRFLNRVSHSLDTVLLPEAASDCTERLQGKWSIVLLKTIGEWRGKLIYKPVLRCSNTCTYLVIHLSEDAWRRCSSEIEI